jgi:hypothetical protein
MGHCIGVVVRTSKTERRSFALAISRRAAPKGTLRGGQSKRTSTPSRSSAAASAHPARGCGTKMTRRTSRPSSFMAATPGSWAPTTPHQWPIDEAWAINEMPSDVAPDPSGPIRTVVVPRWNVPRGKRVCNAGSTSIVREDAESTGLARSLSSLGRGGRAPSGREEIEKANICSTLHTPYDTGHCPGQQGVLLDGALGGTPSRRDQTSMRARRLAG